MIIFNWIGIGMAGLALLMLVATNSVPLACLVLVVLDVPYRLWKRDRRDSVMAGMLAPHSGGHFFFIPCWGWGILLLVGDKLLSGNGAAKAPTSGTLG